MKVILGLTVTIDPEGGRIWWVCVFLCSCLLCLRLCDVLGIEWVLWSVTPVYYSTSCSSTEVINVKGFSHTFPSHIIQLPLPFPLFILRPEKRDFHHQLHNTGLFPIPTRPSVSAPHYYPPPPTHTHTHGRTKTHKHTHGRTKTHTRIIIYLPKLTTEFRLKAFCNFLIKNALSFGHTLQNTNHGFKVKVWVLVVCI